MYPLHFSFGVRLPKIPETRGRKGKLIVFETTDIDTSVIPYRHKEREAARYEHLSALLKVSRRGISPVPPIV